MLFLKEIDATGQKFMLAVDNHYGNFNLGSEKQKCQYIL